MKDDLDEFITKFGSRHGPSNFIKVEIQESDEDEEREVRFSFDYIEEIKALEKKSMSESVKVVKLNSWVKNNTNIKGPSDYSTVYKNAQRMYGIPKNHDPSDHYCCLCGSRHSDEACTTYGYGRYGNQKFQQFDSIRTRLNND